MRRLLPLLLVLASCDGDKRPVAPGGGPQGQSPSGPNQPVTGHRTDRRVVILGFDGVDPDLVDRWQSDLPTLAGWIAGQGTPRLGTTLPPDDAVGWTGFATSRLSATHGVYHTRGRDPITYQPRQELFRYIPPTFDPGGNRITEGGADTVRQGDTFWKTAAAADVKVKVLFAPYIFPPDKLQGHSLMSGTGVPDMRLTEGTWHLLDSGLTPSQAEADLPGGDLIRVVPERGRDGVYRGVFQGPPGPNGKPLALNLFFTVDTANRRVKVEGCEGNLDLGEGQLSEWVGITFPGSDAWNPRGILRILPLEVSAQRVRIFVSPILQEPREPYLAFSSPADWSRYMAESYRLFPSSEGTWELSALAAGVLSPDLFMKVVESTFKQRMDMAVGELRKGDADLFVAWFAAPDLASHAFFTDDPAAPMDPIHQTYRWMDDALRQVQGVISPQDVVIALSVHGFQPFKMGFNVNTWLLDSGYLALRPGIRRSDENGIQRGDVDWSRTRAFSLGNGQIWLNQAGREAQGIVDPASRTDLIQALSQALGAVKTPSGEAPIRAALSRTDAFPGATGDDAPDLQLVFTDGWQASRSTWTGGIPRAQFAENRSAWKGEHGASDPTTTEGFVLANLPGLTRGAYVQDIATTALARLGVALPQGLAGRDMVEMLRDRGALAPIEPPPGSPTRLLQK